MGRILSTVVLLGIGFVVVNSLPDIARYLKIRQM